MATIQVSSETLGEWTALLTALRDSATPAMAERIGTMLSTLGQLTERVSEPAAMDILETIIEKHDALTTSLEQLERWQQDGTWTALTDFASLFTAVKNSATPPMAERIGTLLTQLGKLANKVAKTDALPLLDNLLDNQSELLAIMDQLISWQHSGTWDAIVEFTSLMKALQDSVSPQMSERVAQLAQQAGRGMNQMMDSGVVDLTADMISQLTDAFNEAQADSRKVTLGTMLRAIKDPDIQISLKTLMGLLHRLPGILDSLTH